MIRRYFLFILIFLNDFKLIDLAYVKIHHFDIIIISAIFAGFGQKSTQEVINNNIRHYTEKEKWRTYVKKSIEKTRVCDCYGLLKSYLWLAYDNSNHKYNSL